jgi:miniconductance mechanosensitive channel
MNALKSWLVEQGLADGDATVAAALVAVGLVGLFSVLAYLVAKRILLRLVKVATRRTKTTWDDAFVEARLFSRLSHLVPALIVNVAAPVVLADFPRAASAVLTGTSVYMALVGMTVFDAFLNGSHQIYQGFAISRRFPIRTIVQIVRVAVYFVVGVAVLAILLGKSPLVFFSGLGAFTAVLLLIFKDTLLGFVAGIQLTANNMVRKGDWIEMPGHNADGNVLDVSLTTVKVQNWDKTITTIPTYALVAEPFKNWRGMDESGGRRIKRAVRLDVTSIKFCDAEMLQRFKKIQCISEYVARKLEEVSAHNRDHQVDESLLINGRHLTNVGTFRAYLEHYLRTHPKVHQDMTFLVRQLVPTEHGLPIEIYVFSNDQAWASYEAIQADIFDHVLAVLPLFDLRPFQAPTGADLRALGRGPAGLVDDPASS